MGTIGAGEYVISATDFDSVGTLVAYDIDDGSVQWTRDAPATPLAAVDAYVLSYADGELQAIH